MGQKGTFERKWKTMGANYSINNQNGFSSTEILFSINDQNGLTNESSVRKFTDTNGVSENSIVIYCLQNENGVS